MLDTAQILTYLFALTIAAIIPGPGIISLVARTINGTNLSGVALLLGIISGDIVYLSFAVFGLAMLAQSFSLLFVIIKWGSAIYLGYLAWQFWHAQHQIIDSEKEENQSTLYASYLGGLTITLGNPKTIAFYLALLPVVIDLQQITIQTWLFVLIPLTITVLAGVGGVFIVGAASLRKGLSKSKVQHRIHKGASAAMCAAAISLLVKEV
jgi:threonine/homoserine/homoserine lactone efflux protein